MLHTIIKVMAGLLAILALSAQATTVAIPSQTFFWSGFCDDSDCGAGGTAKATLKVKDTYATGTPLDKGDLLAFTYNPPPVNGIGGPLSAEVNSDFTSVSGGLPAGGVGISNLSIGFHEYAAVTPVFVFSTFADGSWSIGEAITPDPVLVKDSGQAGTSAWGVPEPASLALLGIGLLGLGIRRKVAAG